MAGAVDTIERNDACIPPPIACRAGDFHQAQFEGALSFERSEVLNVHERVRVVESQWQDEDDPNLNYF